MATRLPCKSPFQMSVSPPEATAILPRFSSPVVRTAEVGSCTIALHRLPKAVKIFAFCESIVGYAFTEITDQRFPGERTSQPTYLIELVYEPRPFLWCQPHGVPHEILAAE